MGLEFLFLDVDIQLSLHCWSERLSCWSDLVPLSQICSVIVSIVSGISSAPMVCVSDLKPASHAVECSGLESVWGHSSLSSLLSTFVLTPPSPLPFSVNCRVSLLISANQSMLGFGENCCLSNTGSSHPWTWMHLY